MRTKTITTLLSLAIIAGSTFAADAQRAGAGNRGGNGGNPQTEMNDRGAGDSDSNQNRRGYCYVIGASAFECNPKKNFALPVREDCSCKPVAMRIAGSTQIVLDCYQTKISNGVKRTYVCDKPE